jgi:uncharacterized protein YuzE
MIKQINYSYDPEADAIFIKITSEKADITAELTEHILIDFKNDGRIVGIEILDATEELAKLFGRSIDKKEIQKFLCQIDQEPMDQYLVQFKSPKTNERATLLIPLYKSPLLS